MDFVMAINRMIIICILWFIWTWPGHGQYYTQGEDPASLKWKQINTDHFRVIFPAEISAEAQRTSSLLEFYYDQNSDYLNHKPGKIPVVLHNRSVRSNGFVAWAPKRMELVTTPPADAYPQDFIEQLVLHEFRHVVQVDKMKQGITRGLTWFLGEQAQGAITGLSPFWYLEGDAVDAETKLSFSGRGRLPAFEKEIKALLLEKDRIYPYEKAFYGSYKDFVPTHYHYGYQMVAFGRRKYGKDLWSKMMDYTARKPYTFYPFYFGLKKYASSSRKGLYHETLDTLKSHWSQSARQRSHTSFSPLNETSKKHYTSYAFPRYINDSLFFAEKSGVDMINRFILLDRNGNEKRIHTPGFYYADNISCAGNLITWTEVIGDARWGRQSYSVIKTFDLEKKTEKLLTRNSRYQSPDFSPDGKWIVAVEISLENEYFLVILNTATGEVSRKIPSPGNEFLQFPAWSKDKSTIYVSSLGQDGKKIKTFSLASGTWSTLFYAGYDDIMNLTASEDYLVFQGSFSGIDNIYACHLETNQCYQVTSSRYGAYYPDVSPDGSRIVYADYTASGFNVVEAPFSPATWPAIQEVIDHSEQFNKPGKEVEAEVRKPDYKQMPTYPEKPYSRLSKLFIVHSWMPFYVDLSHPDIENLQVSPGVTLTSQNMLSTAFTTIGYEYNLEEKEHYFHTSFIYRGWYPVIEISYDFGGFPAITNPPAEDDRLDRVKTNMSLNAEISIPLDFTCNKYVKGLRPSVESRFNRSYLWYDDPGEYRTGLTFLDYRLYGYNYLKRSGKDILPRWGQVIDVRFVNAPFQKEVIGNQKIAQGTVYLPGILRHHSIKAKGGWMAQQPEDYLLGNLLSMPRGHDPVRSKEFISASVDYVFPILYPDLKIGPVFYFKRVRASLFYDYARGTDILSSSNGTKVWIDDVFSSMGVELTTDFHFAQVMFPVNSGIRLIYLPGTEKTSTEFVFSINLDRF
jgi:hypothetical protein